MSDAQRGAPPGDDTDARERALDVGQSFLVQAPAGSGKTELLIQRYLALLAHVDRPEAIVATTFTRKAAGEMRERIVAALREAAAGTAVASAHAQRTRELARAALARDAREEWHLVAHPARLAVFTIDAFAAGLARQAPLAARLGAAPRYEERAAPLYATGRARGAGARRCRRQRMGALARAPRQRRGSGGRAHRRHAGEARPVDGRAAPRGSRRVPRDARSDARRGNRRRARDGGRALSRAAGRRARRAANATPRRTSPPSPRRRGSRRI